MGYFNGDMTVSSPNGKIYTSLKMQIRQVSINSTTTLCKTKSSVSFDN